MLSTPFQWSEVRPTRRGVGALAAAASAVALAWLFGARSLNAIAGPVVVGFVVGLGQLVVSSAPTVRRSTAGAGFPGQTDPVTVDVEGGTAILDLSETVPDGLKGEAAATLSPPAAVTYDLTYRDRGVHTLGPVTVTARDVFGLVGYRTELDTREEVVVYPAVYDLAESEALSSLLARRLTPERQEFETVREYAPGDPLRDVHWKTSAKYDDDLFVKEFSGQEPTEALTLVGTATEGSADAMASAVASIAVVVLDAGLSVEVVLPEETVAARPDHGDRMALLRTLATVGPGTLEDEVDPDVEVTGQNGQVTVTVDDRTVRFEELQHGDRSVLEDAGVGQSREVSAG